jgi:hypothetical protein
MSELTTSFASRMKDLCLQLSWSCPSSLHHWHGRLSTSIGWEEVPEIGGSITGENSGVGEGFRSLSSISLMGDPGILSRAVKKVRGEASSDDEDEVGGVAFRIRYCRRYSATIGIMRF